MSESYGDYSFWEAYTEFVDESLSRHRTAIDLLFEGKHYRPIEVLDLGCGKVAEGKFLFGDAYRYTGIDLDPADAGDTVKGDYRGMDFSLLNVSPDLVTSVFSAELTASQHDNYALYTKVFKELSSVQCIVVAGMYYRGYETRHTVQESTGHISWQSIHPPVSSSLFRERRLEIDAPSKLFGFNVVEVWKLFVRQDKEV